MDNGLMIETKGLTKTFGDFTAVDGIDLAVKKGSIHGFVGPNGAGKTTTIKMLIGSIRSTSGEGFIKGHEAGSLEARKSVGYSPEHPFFYEDMAAFDYLVYMARVCGVKRKQSQERATELLKWLDLGDFSWSKVGGFSAGMKQRLSLAQALIHEPELLILDEPTANMDPTGRLSILDKLQQLSEERKATTFLSSHILSELEQVVDSLTMINNGRIVVQGDINDLKKRFAENHFLLKTSQNEAVLETVGAKECVREGWIDAEGFIHLVSEDGDALRREIAKAVAQNNALMEHLSEERASLQDIYRKTMGLEEEQP
ncbi:MAG: ABC transporter ATP-binding protein [Chloroflexi bacterium CG07_land_8_20_14_0_80_51_10]|nr:MAG: ABC transporter ATP-binding protein [Chloroflexi bacterium CG07_land_8_20_14_0_80_51_10]